MPALPSGVRGAVITGWGTALGPTTLTNHDLEKTLDTSHEWIVERSGIHERHVDGTTVGMSVESGRKALEMAGVDPTDIDALVLATTTPYDFVEEFARSLGFDDVMVVVAWDPPRSCRIEKRGRVVKGWAEVHVEPTPHGSRVVWREVAHTVGVPRFAARLEEAAGRRLFGRVVDHLLRT